MAAALGSGVSALFRAGNFEEARAEIQRNQRCVLKFCRRRTL
jgi:hypothetical protein